MFSEFVHDSPDSNDIVLCAGPKERKALETVLLHHTPICGCNNFINDLHAMLQKQTKSIDTINKYYGPNLLREEDAHISFSRHLTTMDQEDVDGVLRHLHAFFIERCYDSTGFYSLDYNVPSRQRKNIFNDIIVPWVDWVRSAKQNKSDTLAPDKAIEQNKIDLSDANIVANTNKKPTNNRKHIMFNKFEHDSPGSDDISLCAGPKEQNALAEVLNQQTNISNVEDFIDELHEALQTQATTINEINTDVGDDILDEEDADISFEQHLSEMNPEDADKVIKHFHALFVDRIGYYVGIHALDEYLSDGEIIDIYHNIIEPWLKWVRSAKKNKSATSKANTNKKSNNKPSNSNNTNTDMNNTTTTANMFESLTSVFANMLGTLEPNMIRMTFDGKVAIKTAKGYKTYDVVKKKAINMDSLVMPEMASFLLLPSTKVKVGDIILRDNAFYSIISIDDATNELIGYNYEAGKKETIVRETHCFLGNTYFYSKLFSPILSFFGNKPKSDKKEEESKDDDASEDTMSALLPLAMMSQNGDMSSLLPLMLMSKMEGKEESSGMMKMLMLSGMMGGGNSNMNNLLPLMMMSGNFPTI